MEDCKIKQFLNAVYQNSKTGMLSIKDIMPAVKHDELRQELSREYDEYEKIATKCEVFAKEHDVDIKDNTWMEKIRLWSSIKMTTIMDNSTRHLAEMLLLGTVMGLNTLYKDKFDYSNTSNEIMQILYELEKNEENNYEKLKGFLKKNI